jgi:hypothetical protein
VSRDDLNRLLNMMLPYAQQMLNQQAQFLPFAGAIGATGEVEMIGGYPGDHVSTSQVVRELLLEGLKQGAREGKYNAVALCCDMRIRRAEGEEPTNAISVLLEHVDGTVITVYLPYARQPNGYVEYGEMNGAAAEACIFPPAATPKNPSAATASSTAAPRGVSATRRAFRPAGRGRSPGSWR